MYIEHDFELSFVHPIQKPSATGPDLESKPFYIFARLEIIGKSWILDSLWIREKVNGPNLNDIIIFCNPDLYYEMVKDASIYLRDYVDTNSDYIFNPEEN